MTVYFFDTTKRDAAIAQFALDKCSGGKPLRIGSVQITPNPVGANDLAAFLARIYTDGTALYLSVKPHRGRKVEREIHGYDSLIRDCIAQGVNRVALLKETATERAARLELEAAEKTTPQVPA